LLGQQFFENETFHEYLQSKFVTYKVVLTEENYDFYRDKYYINSFPTVALFNPDGSEIHRVKGYGPPPERFVERLNRSLSVGNFYFQGSFDEALDKAKTENKTIIALFYSHKWHSSYYLEISVILHKGFSQFFHSNSVIFKAALEEEKDKHLFDKYNVESDATILLIDKEGKEIDRFTKYKWHRYDKFVAGFLDKIAALHPEAKDCEIEYSDLKVPYYQYSGFLKGKIAAKKNILYDENPELLKVFIKTYPESPLLEPAFELLSTYYQDSKSGEDALSFFEECISVFPENPEILLHYSNFLITTNRQPQKADDMLNKAAVMKSGDFKFRKSIAEAYLNMKRSDRAAEVFGTNFIRDYEKECYKLNEYAWFWANKEENLEIALEIAQKAVELKPDHYNWDTLSLVNFKLKRYEEALRAEEEASDLTGGRHTGYIGRINDIKAAMSEK